LLGGERAHAAKELRELPFLAEDARVGIAQGLLGRRVGKRLSKAVAELF